MLARKLPESPIAAPLSIALVTDWCPPRVGGIERHVAGLAHALANRGHAVHLFTTTPDASPIAGVTIHQIETAMIGEVAAPNLWRVRELRAMLVDAGITLVHAHGMFSTLAIGSLLAAHGAGIPSVTTHHSLLRHSPTLPAAWITYRLFSRRATVVTAVSHAAADDARRASGRTDVPILPNGLDREMWTRQLSVRLPAPMATPVRLKADATYPDALTTYGDAVATHGDAVSRGDAVWTHGDAVETQGDAVAICGDAGVRSVRLQPDRETDQPNRESDRPDRESDRDVLRVVSVMRLAKKKSPHDLIDAVPVVLTRAHRDVVFTIVGDGPERAHLEHLARRLGVAPQVEFLGACAPTRVAEVLAQSHLFALPSRREAFGIAVLEARAAGLPIVACASGGIPEVVEHGRHGLLVNTPQEFAGAIATLITDDALRERCAAVSGDGLDTYSWDRVVDRHETVYQQAMVAFGFNRGRGG
jgi:glycosyltransferase involved in cell wall biosynthesis